MNIYFSGDSNTAGTELLNPKLAFSYKLGEMLGASNITVDAIAGASNDTIFRDTDSYLRSCTNLPDFVVIGWTSPEREDWFINGSYRSLNKFELFDDGVNIEKDARYLHFLEHQAKDHEYHMQMQKYWHSKIYNYHLELAYRKIPHLFFNAIYSFGFWTHTPMFKYEWDNTFITPYEPKTGAYVQYCTLAGHKEITPGWFHFDESAHQDWANVLYQHINAHNLIKAS